MCVFLSHFLNSVQPSQIYLWKVVGITTMLVLDLLAREGLNSKLCFSTYYKPRINSTVCLILPLTGVEAEKKKWIHVFEKKYLLKQKP